MRNLSNEKWEELLGKAFDLVKEESATPNFYISIAFGHSRESKASRGSRHIAMTVIKGEYVASTTMYDFFSMEENIGKLSEFKEKIATAKGGKE